MLIGYFFGTVQTGKNRHIFNSLYLSKKYRLNTVLIRPNIPNLYDDPYEVKYKNKKIKHQATIIFPGSLSLISEDTNVILVQYSHLFLPEDLLYLIKFFRKRWSYNSLVAFFGLEKNYLNETYPSHEILLKAADYVEKHYTICNSCKEFKATHNQALYLGREAPLVPKSMELRLHYEPRCEMCYVHPKDTNFYLE